MIPYQFLRISVGFCDRNEAHLAHQVFIKIAKISVEQYFANKDVSQKFKRN